MKNITLFGCLIFLFVFGNLFAYHSWNQSFQLEANQDIVLTDSRVVSFSQRLVQSKQLNLIPKGAIQKANDIYEISYTYQVEMDLNKDIQVDFDDIFLLKEDIYHEDLYQLVCFESFVTYIQYETYQVALIEVVVSLNMPEDDIQATLLQSSQIVFHVNLSYKN